MLLRARRSNQGSGLWLAALLLLLTITTIAHAEEVTKKSHTYAPDYCEFNITFPDDPYTTRRCDNDGKKCYDQISYTQVFEMQSTVNFRVFCNPIDKNIIDSYSGEVMEATLRAMTKRSVVETYNTSFREEETYKQAGLVGQGASGKLPTLYIAQLWIGQKSAFSVEAELIGQTAEGPDTLFRDVLRSVGLRVKKAKKERENEGVEMESMKTP